MIVNADCLDHLKTLPDNTVDCLVTDPPYGLKFMGKDWDMAVPSVDIWKECLRVMKPGSFGYIFCIPRQDCLSRMMMSLEQAGFNVNFSSIYWTYASGFPKSLNMGKAIDKRAGAKREVVGKNERIATSYTKGDSHIGNILKDKEQAGILTTPATPEAKKLEGSYGGFQPKPASMPWTS